MSDTASSSEFAPGSPPTPASRRALLRWAADALEDAGRDEPYRTAEWLLIDILDCRRLDLHLEPDARVTADAARAFGARVRRRAEGEPIQHILGYDEFYGVRLAVTPDVLIPRPETEELVERALDLLRDREAPRVLDVGTGSGCIALALATERPDARVAACDVSAGALAVARRNARRLDLDVRCFEADLFDAAFLDRVREEGGTGLDLLISNPPYIPDAEIPHLPAIVREHDPEIALRAGDDPLRFYRQLADEGREACAAGAILLVEAHAEYADDVAAVFRAAQWSDVRVEDDLAGRPRMVWGRCPPAPTP